MVAGYLFFRCDEVHAQRATKPLPDGFSVLVWRPGIDGFPTGHAFSWSNLTWWAWLKLGIFASPAAGVLMIRLEHKVVHRSLVSPRWYRFPDMAAVDLQIGDTWTDPDFRGRGLAKAAIQLIHELWTGEFERMWYLVEEGNHASVNVIRTLGYELVGRGDRTAPYGIRLLGRFRITAMPRSTT